MATADVLLFPLSSAVQQFSIITKMTIKLQKHLDCVLLKSHQWLNSRFQRHRVETGNASFIDPYNCLVSLKDNIRGFVNSLLNTTASVQIGFSISVGLVKSFVEESIEAYFTSNF